MGKKFDELLTHLGTGRWNIFYMVTLSYSYLLPSYHALGGAFLAPIVSYTCLPPAHALTSDQIIIPTTATLNSTTKFECTYLVENTTSGEVLEETCTEWLFDNSTFTSTVTSQFQLACGRDYYRALYQALYMAGVFFGAPLSGLLSDKHGRKNLIVIGSALFTVLAIGSCWANNIHVLLLARFLLGMLQPSFTQSSYTLIMEVLEPTSRSQGGLVITMPWSLGLVTWGGFAYLMRDWRMLQLTASLTCLPFFLVFLFIDESPRWLAVQGRYEEALLVLQKAARWNKVSLPPTPHVLQCLKEERCSQVEEQCVEGSSGGGVARTLTRYLHSFAILVRTRRIRTIACGCYLNYFAIALVYFGITISGGNYGIDIFSFMTLSGVMEAPACLAFPLVNRVGRKAIIICCSLFTGACLLITPFLPAGIDWLEVTLVMLGKMAVNAAFTVIILFTTELFPTEVRVRGLGTSLMVSRIATMLAPIIVEYLVLVYSRLPSVVFGTATLVTGLVTFNLPETLGVALSDTISHLEKEHQQRVDDELKTPEYKENGPPVTIISYISTKKS